MLSNLRKSNGFTVAELVTVMAILAILAAIAIPITLNQRASASEAAQRADLTLAVTKVQELLIGYNGVPPTDITITSTADTWQATDTNGTTLIQSTLSTETTLSGSMWTDGSWCVDNFDSNTGTVFSYQSDIGEIQEGFSCPTTALGGIGSVITSSPLTLPGQVSSVSVDTTVDNQLSITWTAASNATSYAVVVVGQSTTTVYSESALITGLLPGDATISIYAIGDQGAGQPVTVSATVAGLTDLQALDQRVTQAETDLADALSRIAALENAGP